MAGISKVSDVFVESPGLTASGMSRDAFVESRGRERVSDGRLGWQARSVTVQKLVPGFLALDPTENGLYVPSTPTQPRQYYKNLRRRWFSKTQSMSSDARAFDPRGGGPWDYSSTVAMSISTATSVPSISGYWIPPAANFGGKDQSWDDPHFFLSASSPIVQDIQSLIEQKFHGPVAADPVSGTVTRDTVLSNEESLSFFLTKVNTVIRGINISEVRNTLDQAVPWGDTWKLYYRPPGFVGPSYGADTSYNEWSGPVAGTDYWNGPSPVDFHGYNGAVGSTWLGLGSGASPASLYAARLGQGIVAAEKAQVRGITGFYAIAQAYFNASARLELGVVMTGHTAGPLDVINIPLPDGNDMPPDPSDPTQPLWDGVMNYLVTE